MQAGITIREVVPGDWPQFKRIRLRMLAEIPLAFGETLAAAEGRSDAGWAARVRGYSSGSRTGNGLRLAAVDDASGEWVGTMGGFLPPEDRTKPMLVGVYVAPEARGNAAGITDALLERVETWARGHGTELFLHVHADNARARASYRRRGFVDNGVTVPYILDSSQLEFEMAKSL
jgi:GNAT superfamily N-acetyltransferase